jgi:hypothetical protein
LIDKYFSNKKKKIEEFVKLELSILQKYWSSKFYIIPRHAITKKTVIEPEPGA